MDRMYPYIFSREFNIKKMIWNEKRGKKWKKEERILIDVFTWMIKYYKKYKHYKNHIEKCKMKGM